MQTTEVKKRLLKELALLAILGCIGLAVLPLCIYLVGEAIFGEYGNGGFSGFFAALHRELRQGEPAVWFLLLSPYLLWQLVRLTFRAAGQFGRSDEQAGLDGREAAGKL